ncbi:MAG: CDGSH iron-sulfur domain-containing protein [Arenimonas sp.]
MNPSSPQPIVVDVVAGQAYEWCRCGRSAAQPFCDDSHEGTGIEPIVFVAARNERVWLCVCKQSHRAPFCDGTHNKLDRLP